MNKIIIFFLYIFLTLTAFGGKDLPVVQQRAEFVEDIIPVGWGIKEKVVGDLNNDGRDDCALVIQNTDKKNMIINDGLGADSVDANPRILLIYFKDSKTNEYKKILQSNTFIIKHDEPTMDEPFDGLAILKGGVLKISFRIWYSAGSYGSSNHSYKFRYGKEQFELIGSDIVEIHRATGAMTSYSLNFLTKKMSITKENISGEEPKKVEWKKIKLDKLKTFETFSEPFSWEVSGLIL